ncbi:uncharacterized protein QYS62_011608 [Fusarium acuminatum]|uniref:Rhodopsin domain-containing protein n=1 Tax=Fusarium acuminatum TaxID=5515 RepID=A0ABZ2XBG9_9HYPO
MQIPSVNGVQGVLGVHVWEMSLDDVTWETTLILAANLLVIPGTALAKLVLCVVYYRLSPMPWYRYVIYGTAVLMVVAFTSVWFSLLLACKPVEAAWNLRLFTGSNCIDRYPVHILQASIGGVTDLVLMVITFITILPLQMQREKKAAVIAFLSTGLLTLGAAVVRLVILVTRLKDPDTTFVLAQGTLCLIVEANLVIICGSLPNFRIFIKYVSKHVLRVFAKPQIRSWVWRSNDTLTGDHRLEGDGPADRRPQRFGRRVALGRSGSRWLLGIPNALDKV